jgi:hypothetical protein
MRSRNALPSFLQCCRWLVARTHTALQSLLSSTRGIRFAQTFHFFPKLYVRI